MHLLSSNATDFASVTLHVCFKRRNTVQNIEKLKDAITLPINSQNGFANKRYPLSFAVLSLSKGEFMLRVECKASAT